MEASPRDQPRRRRHEISRQAPDVVEVRVSHGSSTVHALQYHLHVQNFGILDIFVILLIEDIGYFFCILVQSNLILELSSFCNCLNIYNQLYGLSHCHDLLLTKSFV